MSLKFYIADYTNLVHASHVVDLLDAYAQDDMGGGEPLSDFTRANLTSALQITPGAFSVIGELNDAPVALANCFQGFSTFACKPLLNIHDLVVLEGARGKGLSQGLLDFVEVKALALGCCKVTLEVLEGNKPALAAYKKFGFDQFTMDEDNGAAVFLQKKLEA